MSDRHGRVYPRPCLLISSRRAEPSFAYGGLAMTSSAALSKFAAFTILAGLLSSLASRDTGAEMALPRPDDGAIANSSYTNPYFDLSYPLLPRWTEGLAGPEPSYTGYYVLKTLVPEGELTGMILVAAQDQFFAPTPLASA